jgi:hypothetical protein
LGWKLGISFRRKHIKKLKRIVTEKAGHECPALLFGWSEKLATADLSLRSR